MIRPALERGAIVVTDRYVDSSIAYQGAGRDLDADDVARLSRWATDGLVPDLTVLLDLPPEISRVRTGRRPATAAGDDRLESLPDDFHERVRERFLDLARREPHRYLVLDASDPREQLQEAIRRRVRDLVPISAARRADLESRLARRSAPDSAGPRPRPRCAGSTPSCGGDHGTRPAPGRRHGGGRGRRSSGSCGSRRPSAVGPRRPSMWPEQGAPTRRSPTRRSPMRRLVTREVVATCREVVTREVVTREVVTREVVTREVVTREVVLSGPERRRTPGVGATIRPVARPAESAGPVGPAGAASAGVPSGLRLPNSVARSSAHRRRTEMTGGVRR